ncbi:MAG TPA: RNA-binding cell elongation regulator Jag/EloR [Fimbriimonadaceae bacterium]|nr:RNA-binding cell elongation regulator Jag/EloR [Fimbriimonadaceae bacterium]
MQSIEIAGKSVQEATKAAAAKLGVAEDAVEVTVLEETKGLFGKGNVRIRAEVKTAPTQAAVAVEEPPAKAPAKARRGAKKAAPAEEPATVEAPTEAAAADEEVGPAPADVQASDADADHMADLIRDILSKADLTVEVKVTGTTGRYVNIELDGKDVAHLVGKHGEVLNALQYLVNVVAGRRFANGVRVTLEGNNYRRRREEALTTHANKIADLVLKRGEEAVLDALPAFERRIVHKALSEKKGITTYSEGEEPNRRVVIAPAD